MAFYHSLFAVKIINMKPFFWRFSTSYTLRLGLAAALVGLLSGAGVWLFKKMFEELFGLLFAGRGWWEFLFPVLGGLLVGWLAQRALQGEKLHGTAAIMQAEALAGGRLPYLQAPLKTLAAILSLGFGAAVGPEDPSVQIGANLGSFVGQKGCFSEEATRVLVAAGAASAIAAAFNAPIAGVFFGLEIILGEVNSAALGVILVAAVGASVFTQAFSGASPAFLVPAYRLVSLWELPLYLLLGGIAGVVSALYVRLLYRAQDFFAAWKTPLPLKTAAAGALVGLTGFFLPQALGVGYETISEALSRDALPLLLLLALLAAKLILTPVSIGGGFVGGVFAPSLYVGAMLGGAFGLAAQALFPSLGLAPAAYALVGMAAVLAGATHAPLTASLLLFEMTNDYRIILPLLFSVAVSLMLSQRLQRESVYTLGLARHGIRLERGRDLEVMSTMRVEEVMRPVTDALREEMPLDEAAEALARSRRHGLPVLDDQGRLTGILTLGDVDRARGATVGEACTRTLQVASPQEPLSEALRRMSHLEIGRLPVVSPEDPTHLLGILRRADVIQAYEVALARRAAQRQHQQAARLNAFTPSRISVWEVEVTPDSPVQGKSLAQITLPRQCVAASLRRGAQAFVPRGDTILLPGDVLTFSGEEQARAGVLNLLQPVQTGEEGPHAETKSQR